MPVPNPELFPSPDLYPGSANVPIPGQAVVVRERPSSRLSIEIKAPNGNRTRWGFDEHDPANVPSALTFTHTMPGGFEQLSCTLPRKPGQDYADLVEFSMLTAHGVGGDVAWQGRLETTPRTSGDQMTITPGAVGWQAALDDNQNVTMIYIDRSLTSQWQDPSNQRQLALSLANRQLGSSAAAQDGVKPAIVATIQDSWVSPWVPTVESWYDAGAGNVIAKIYYDASFDSSLGGNTSFQAFVELSIDPLATTYEATANLYQTPFGEITGYFTPTTSYRYALLQYLFNATPAGTQGAVYNTYWNNMAVYGNHGLTGYGPDPVGFLASDVVAHAVKKWAPVLSTARAGVSTIQPSTYVIPHLTFPTPTTVTDVITQATQYEMLDWWIDEGPTFNLASRANHGRQWRARAGISGLQETGPQVAQIWNQVVVQYTDVAGIARTAGPIGSGCDTVDASLSDPDPLNPATLAGLTRCSLVAMGTSTAAAAVVVGAIFLQEQKQLSTAGQATLVGPQMDDKGVLWPAWMIRSGDQISFIDAADPEPRRIVSASYDDATRTCQIDLDSPPQGLAQLLQRLSVSLVATGFT